MGGSGIDEWLGGGGVVRTPSKSLGGSDRPAGHQSNLGHIIPSQHRCTCQIVRVHTPLATRVGLHKKDLQIHQLAEGDAHLPEIFRAFGLQREAKHSFLK